MKELKVLLIGQPNVGKSSLLNALVGPRVLVSNYPGTTVEITQAKKVFNSTRVDFVDTPGIYSISDRSEEEKVTEKSLFEEEINVALVVADATAIERSLYLVLQILEAEIPIVLALNFVEEAERKGLRIDSERIESILNVPVIFINPITNSGIDTLVDSLLRIKERAKSPNFRVEYDDHIEKAIDKISAQVQVRLPKRFVALRILEGDEHFYGYLPDRRLIEQTKEGVKEHPELEKDISITRYGTASFIAEQTTHIIPLEDKEKPRDKFDNIILHKVWGPLTTGLFLISIFGILLS
jgi:ferrous iron transport protein B